MAGMNVEEKQDMSRFILDVNDEFGTTIVLIEHDMGSDGSVRPRGGVDYGATSARHAGRGSQQQILIDAYLGVATRNFSPQRRKDTKEINEKAEWDENATSRTTVAPTKITRAGNSFGSNFSAFSAPLR